MALIMRRGLGREPSRLCFGLGLLLGQPEQSHGKIPSTACFLSVSSMGTPQPTSCAIGSVMLSCNMGPITSKSPFRRHLMFLHGKREISRKPPLATLRAEFNARASMYFSTNSMRQAFDGSRTCTDCSPKKRNMRTSQVWFLFFVRERRLGFGPRDHLFQRATLPTQHEARATKIFSCLTVQWLEVDYTVARLSCANHTHTTRRQL